MKQRIFTAMLLAAGLFGLSAAAAGAAPAASRAVPGRVSSLQGRLLVRGPDDSDWSYLARNAVVYDGDIVRTDRGSLAEIELERGAWLRLGPDTRLDIRRLPPAGEIALKRGALYLDLAGGAASGTMVRLPNGTIMTAPGSLARIDLNRQDGGRLMVRRGRVMANLRSRSGLPVSAGQLLVMAAAAAQPRLIAIDSREFDTFDDWSDNRVAYYLDRPLPRGFNRYVPGAAELADYGSWVDYNGSQYWRPTRIADNWRPYSNGTWSYGRSEPVWVDNEPWGYTTSHYGGWSWADSLGWLWGPGSAWSPAMVSWANLGNLIGWAPLNPFGQVVTRRRPVDLGGMLVDSLVWSALPRESFLRLGPTWAPARILALDQVPVVQLRTVRPIRSVDVVFRDVPDKWRLRGMSRIEGFNTVAGARFRDLERRAPRAEFRLAGLPSPQSGRIRAETLARVRRQRTVPQALGSKGAGAWQAGRIGAGRAARTATINQRVMGTRQERRPGSVWKTERTRGAARLRSPRASTPPQMRRPAAGPGGRPGRQWRRENRARPGGHGQRARPGRSEARRGPGGGGGGRARPEHQSPRPGRSSGGGHGGDHGGSGGGHGGGGHGGGGHGAGHGGGGHGGGGHGGGHGGH